MAFHIKTWTTSQEHSACNLLDFFYVSRGVAQQLVHVGILLVHVQKQPDEVRHNHTRSIHTSIITSQIRSAYDNFHPHRLQWHDIQGGSILRTYTTYTYVIQLLLFNQHISHFLVW